MNNEILCLIHHHLQRNKRTSQKINDQYNGQTQNNTFIYLIFTGIKLFNYLVNYNL